jgi:hypothetical protein
MPATTTERVHLSVAEARALSERAMRGIGYDAEEARIRDALSALAGGKHA